MKVKFITKLFFIVLVVGCNSKGIESCGFEKLNYSELPIEVKQVIFKTEYEELNTPNRYELFTKQDKLLPWVYNSRLKRIDNGKIYELNFSSEHRSRYIILEDFLYVPRHYNIYESDSLRYTFSKILLD